MLRNNYPIEDLLNEIAGTPEGVGIDLSLTEVYDKIKEARVEEDHNLSFGIWERELKKADWTLVEKLTFDALKNKSKDLQILAWFIESIMTLDGFSGALKGIQLLTSFIDLFWHSSYPHNENNTSDTEQKFRILDWIYETLGKKALFIPIPSQEELNRINLYNYEYAIEIRNLSLKSGNKASEILENAKHNNIRTIDEIQNTILTWKEKHITFLIKTIAEIKQAKEIFETTIAKISQEDARHAFKKFSTNLEKIEKIVKGKEQKPEENTEINIVNEMPNTKEADLQLNREKLYHDIKMIAENLKKIEKHSLSYYILELIVSWKDKELIEIIQDLKSGESKALQLLKILTN